MEQLTGLDASFLYLETPSTPMHVGGVSVVEGSLEFDRFREFIAGRLHLVPKLRQRLVEAPMGIDYPFWVDDPEFNLDMHLSHVALPQPAGWRELRALASRAFSQALDRSRPLWEIVFVEGINNIPQLPNGSVAIISKVHHAAIDGVSGADIMGVLFDMTPEPAVYPEPEPFDPGPIPGPVDIAARSVTGFVRKPLKLPRLVGDAVAATFKTGVLRRVQGMEAPGTPFSAPRTRLNGTVSSQRLWNTALLDLERVKVLRRASGSTLNDVMLAICSGALRRYLDEKGELPDEPLVAMMPMSTRSSDSSAGGNQINTIFVQLATDIEDPIERLERINSNTARGKTYSGAIGASTLANAVEFVPFGLANRASQIYSRMELAKRHAPIMNTLITNVPGPQFPLYIDGHQLIAHMGMAPVIDGLGLLITIFSYNGVISVSPITDPTTMPDVDTFTRYIREAANELEAAILADVPQKLEPVDLGSGEAFEAVSRFLGTNPRRPFVGVGVFEIGDTSVTIDLSVKPGTVSFVRHPDPDAVVIVSDEHLMRMLDGSLARDVAELQSRVRYEGAHAKKLLSLLLAHG